jgi:hypothetical protein
LPATEQALQTAPDMQDTPPVTAAPAAGAGQ